MKAPRSRRLAPQPHLLVREPSRRPYVVGNRGSTTNSRKIGLTFGLMLAVASQAQPAAAQAPPAPAQAPPAPADAPRIDLEVYGSLLPFLEYVGTSGATAAGYMGSATQVPAAAYTGINDPGRLRMTAGTS